MCCAVALASFKTSLTMSLHLILSSILLFLLICFCWFRRRLYWLSWKIPGPFALPIIGNAYLFLGNAEDQLVKIVDLLKIYSSPMRFWLGPNLIISFRHPSQVQKILSSSKITHKHDIYKYMKPYLGNGLVTSSGIKWRTSRQFTQPMFGLKFVSQNVDSCENYINFVIGRFKEFANGGYFEVEHVVHTAVVDLVGDILFGWDLETRRGKNKDFADCLRSAYDQIILRMTKPWLQIDFIFNMTRHKTEEGRVVQLLHRVFDKLINEALVNNHKGKNRSAPIVGELARKFEANSKIFDDSDFKHNVITLFAASEDTVTAIVCGGLVAFGMYPEVQEKVITEIRQALGNSQKFISYEDTIKMDYLDMCVKEVLRIFPIAHLIFRKTVEDFEIDDLVIPKGCAIAISIFNLHLDPRFWEKPMEFYPEHFLPKAVRERPVFTHIPFSAGPRGCIGKIFAHNVIKLFLANILRSFKIEAEGKYMDQYKNFKADISVRPKDGYNIKITERSW